MQARTARRLKHWGRCLFNRLEPFIWLVLGLAGALLACVLLELAALAVWRQ